ncbi:MAG TPA: gamma-glutamylcyclotransferase [Kofleriaceae bacterium]|nr:gamma-glutamylcyclotransferase [Kofleriaceae bacterium]
MSPGTSWIFGYGSLIWRPAFPHLARRPGWIDGWSRRLWQRSTDHRGTTDAPGRVATLIRAAGARCGGAAYQIDGADLPSVLDALHVREQQGYDAIHLEVRLDDGSTVSATTWVATDANPYFAGDESVAAIADVVRRSHGPSGSNLEYVLELERALAALGAPDPHVTAIADILRPRGDESAPGALHPDAAITIVRS